MLSARFHQVAGDVMRRVVLALLLLLVAPSLSFARMSPIDTGGYTPHSSKSGSTFYKKKTRQYQRTSASNNLATKAAKAANTGSKLGIAGGVAKKLVHDGKMMSFGTIGLGVLHLAGSLYKDVRDNPDNYPTFSNLLCQMLGICPSDPTNTDPILPPLGLTYNCGNYNLVLKDVRTTSPYGCFNSDYQLETNYNLGQICRYHQAMRTVPGTRGSICQSIHLSYGYKDIDRIDYYFQVKAISENPIYPDDLTQEQEESLSDFILQQLEKLNDTADRLADELETLLARHPDSLLWDPLDPNQVKGTLRN